MIKAGEKAIAFNTADRQAVLKNKRALKNFIASKVRAAGFGLLSLDFIFGSDEYLIGINRSFLGHDDYTDIITFNLSDSPSDIQGEVYISVDRVKENAATFGATFEHELHRVIFHGVLHLLGFEDKEPADKEQMSQMEDVFLAEYFSLSGHQL